MTINSPNPVDGDVQVLIEYCKCEIEKFKRCVAEYPDAPVLRSDLKLHEIALAALTAPPAQILRPVELPDEAPNALIALCHQVYDSRITGSSVAQDVWQDCLDELRQQGYEVKND